jgi:hypothetical protein
MATMKLFCNFATVARSFMFVDALLAAGYQQTADYQKADFILTDKEPTSPRDGTPAWRRERFIKQCGDRPVTIIPHTPYCAWLWDRWLEPMKVSCNFVTAPVGVMAMSAYGYPYRFEEIGWARGPIQPFSPRSGNNLLYAPPLNVHWKEGVLKYNNDLPIHRKVLAWIVENRKHFDRVTLNYTRSMEEFEYNTLPDMGFEFFDVGSKRDLSTKTATSSIEKADLILSSNTMGYIALANGYPTLLTNSYRGVPPTCATGAGEHWDDYKEHYEFPLCLFDMTADEVLALRDAPNAEVEDWKAWNVGSPFMADKFISVIREFV